VSTLRLSFYASSYSESKADSSTHDIWDDNKIFAKVHFMVILTALVRLFGVNFAISGKDTIDGRK